ncbi:unnamed protein product [marine sediment metagenome]|uniref:Uncharacterized protein n=1 Tax=marine sediment metagenome TaxID=412755 RepID=X1I0V0_9ZZZZ
MPDFTVFCDSDIFETFLAVVKRITEFMMALLAFYGTGDEPVHELDALFAPVSVVAESIPATPAQLSLPVVVMDLNPPMRVDHSDFAVGQADKTTNRTCGDHVTFFAFLALLDMWQPAADIEIVR